MAREAFLTEAERQMLAELNNLTLDTGDILIGDDGSIVELDNNGTSGQVLTSNGAGFLPTWEDAGGGGVDWGDIGGTLSDQTDLQSALDGKVDENASITGATKTKITYDAKGLVTGGDDATTADIADSTDRRYVTDAEQTVIQNTSGTNTGDQTITLTGDVTGTGTGSFSATIANDAVTFAKMQNIATEKLIGRHTASSGDPEEVGIGGGIEFNSGNIRRSALAGDVTASAGDNTTTVVKRAEMLHVEYATTIEIPTDSEDIAMFRADKAITATKVSAVLRGSSSPSVTWTIRYGSDRSATGTEIVTGGTTTTSTTTGSVVTSLNNTAISAGDWVWIETTAQSGDVDEIVITLNGTL